MNIRKYKYIYIYIAFPLFRFRYFIVKVNLCVFHDNTFVNVMAEILVILIYSDFVSQRMGANDREINFPAYEFFSSLWVFVRRDL